jgi:large subunit ribosomal protein L16
MLQPKKPRYRKQMKLYRHLTIKETRGCTLEFGEYGLRAMEPGWVTNRQIEAARQTMVRHIKRGGKVWLKVYPDKPLTKKPAEVRMGKGKGSVEVWVAEVKSGRIMYEITGVAEKLAVEALELAAAKLPIKTKIVIRSSSLI